MGEKSRKKTSFLIYRSDRPMIEALTDQQAGMLFKALFVFADTDEIVSIPDPVVNAFYKMMVDKMKRDNQKYEARCEQNSKNQLERWNKAQIQELQAKKKMLIESGLSTEVVDKQLKDAIEKSGIPPDTTVYDRIQTNTKDTTVYDRIHSNTKHTDIDRDIDTDRDIDRDREPDREIDRDRGAGERGRKNPNDELSALRMRFTKMAKQKLSSADFSEIMNHVLSDVSRMNPDEQESWFKEKLSTMGG